MRLFAVDFKQAVSSMQRWVTVFLLSFLWLPHCFAHSISVDGTAQLEDGAQIKGATVIIYEYVDQGIGRMPKGHPVAIAVTNKDGKFHVDLDKIEGPLDVSLVRDRCDWTGASIIVPSTDFKKKTHYEVVLDAHHDQCEGRTP